MAQQHPRKHSHTPIPNRRHRRHRHPRRHRRHLNGHRPRHHHRRLQHRSLLHHLRQVLHGTAASGWTPLPACPIRITKERPSTTSSVAMERHVTRPLDVRHAAGQAGSYSAPPTVITCVPMAHATTTYTSATRKVALEPAMHRHRRRRRHLRHHHRGNHHRHHHPVERAQKSAARSAAS